MDRKYVWKRGLPRGKFTQEMLDKYEFYFSPIGEKWYRLKPPTTEKE